MEESPREIIMVPKVAINGGKPNLAIRIPLNKPNTPPITKIAKSESQSGQPSLV